MFHSLSFKIPGTRKLRNFTLYPESETHYILQSSDCIVSVDLKTLEMKYAVDANGAYFHHLIFAKPFESKEILYAIGKKYSEIRGEKTETKNDNGSVFLQIQY